MHVGGWHVAQTARCAALDAACVGCSEDIEGFGGFHLRRRSSRSKTRLRAVAAINAAIIAIAKAFAEQGIKDGVQVNSVVPGAVMTRRRRSFMEHWAPAHGMSVEDAIKQFPDKAGI